MSRKTSLPRLAPDVAVQLSELQDQIKNLGEVVGAALAAQAEQQQQKEPERAPVRERLTTELVIEEASPTRCHRARAVAKRLDIHVQTLWRWCRQGDFPPGVKIGPMRTVWSEATIATWLAERANDSVGRGSE